MDTYVVVATVGHACGTPKRRENAGPVIFNWPERIKTQPHDDRDNCFLPFDSKGPCGMTVFNDIDDDSATKHSDFHTRNSHRQSV